MKRVLATTPKKSDILALYQSLLRQARLLPHEYLRYLFIAFLSCLFGVSCVTCHSQFFRLKLSDDIKSALDDSRKDKQRQATFNRLRKVTKLNSGVVGTDRPVGTLEIETC
jgi:hypothetical protein